MAMVLSGLVAVLIFGSVGALESRPNIILFVLDDLGWNDVGFHGSSEIPTPNIDALAYNGVIFDKHYVMQSCTPSRAALLTGQYPIRLGFQGFPIRGAEDRGLPRGVKTLPSELKKIGYRTHLVGKWHLGRAKREHTPLAFGFDSHYGYWGGFVGYFNQAGIGENNMTGKDFYDNLTPVDGNGALITDLFTERSLRIIEQHPKKQPLFLSINHLAAHTGVTDEDVSVLEVANRTNTDKKYGHIKDGTRRMLAEIMEAADESVGKVIAKLEETGLLENSVLVFMSDNGAPTVGLYATSSSNFPLRGIKMGIFEGAVRVPAAIYYPNMKNKSRIYNNLFHITDWVPTLYAAAGGNSSVFADVDGVNHWENIRDDTQLIPRDEMLVNIDDNLGIYAYISENGRYKIVKANPTPLNNFSGEEGQDCPDYIQNVLKSVTNSKLPTASSLHNETICGLRESAGLPNCRLNVTKLPTCEDWCLFDLEVDPCETNDLSLQEPARLNAMISKIDYYATQVEHLTVNLQDENANPKYCNGHWFNWLDGEDGCFFTRKDWSFPTSCL